MIFTSYTYVVFLAAAFLLHWSMPPSWRNGFLIAASYAFYGFLGWEPVILLTAVSLFNWAYAQWVLSRCDVRGLLSLGICVNLAPLAYFKYASFLTANAALLVHGLGATWQPAPDHVLPILGISFFTFQGIAYLVDVAAGEAPLYGLLDFLLFNVLWAKLIAGPILRGGDVREQIRGPRSIDYSDAAAGCQRILAGFFKKVVLADNLAPIVDMVFRSTFTPHVLDCTVAILGFGLQVYLDFSGYCDIAVGSARLFGFRLPENFNWPYLSRSPQEFWTRWHITLSQWIRDYLFTPLSFASRSYPKLLPLCLLFAMGICGLWHGAAWTFLVWGLWHGLLLVLNQSLPMLFPGATRQGRRGGFVGKFGGWCLTFLSVQAGWVFFRAPSLRQAWKMLGAIAGLHGGLRFSVLRENQVLVVAVFFAAVCAAQLYHVYQPFVERAVRRWSLPRQMVRAAVFTAMILAIIVFDQEAASFVYFQF